MGGSTERGNTRPYAEFNALVDRGLRARDPPADLPHIFEPFYRGAEALSQQIHGNGLGLSIVRSIVEAHGGRVTVTSARGKGSTFTMHLPVAKGETEPMRPPCRSRTVTDARERSCHSTGGP